MLYEVITIAPEAAVGDHVLGLVGALDYTFGLYRLALTESPSLVPGSASPSARQNSPSTLDKGAFTFATFNLENLFETVDDP